MISIKAKNSKRYDKQDVLKLVKALDSYFKPTLSQRVNLQEYVNKLDKYSTMGLAYNDSDTLIGLIAFYDNDQDSKKAFISILGVLPNYQEQGIASMLMNECIVKSKLSGMKELLVKTEVVNSKAIKFYNRIGFQEVEKLKEFGVEKIKLGLSLKNQ